MSGSEISPQTAAFIRRHIRSIGLLEALLLLQADAPQPWSAERLARELFVQENGALGFLSELERSGLVKRTGDGSFLYATRNPQDDAVVQDLRDAYNERRVTVTSLIYARPSDAQTFADSFVFRKKSP
ncbi:hypothetical protein [Uliginosibacterium sp. H1]|uniref:hypothetical protein n=1 Tax=Uliginosibacterium sp. H1 TaxID=3114757 RepID=UPI002E19C22F|nr:hypothetical protein [Uliginosibacterium sp. H1]